MLSPSYKYVRDREDFIQALQAMIPEDLVPQEINGDSVALDIRLRALVEIALGKRDSLG